MFTSKQGEIGNVSFTNNHWSTGFKCSSLFSFDLILLGTGLESSIIYGIFNIFIIIL